MEEIWRQCVDEKHQVSNKGNVKYKNKIMSTEHNHLGYESVKIMVNGKRKHFKVHRLVAMAFIPNPNNYPVVNHKDENPRNNNASNLEWCTQKYNMNYGTFRNRASRSHAGKPCQNHLERPVCQYDLKGNFIASYESIAKASIASGIDRSNIRAICNGKTKNPRKYIFKFMEEKLC